MPTTSKKAAKKTATAASKKKAPTPAATGAGGRLHDDTTAARRRPASSVESLGATTGVKTQISDREVAAAASAAQDDGFLVPPTADTLSYAESIGPGVAETWRETVWPALKRLWNENANVRITIVTGGTMAVLALLIWAVS